MIKITGSNFQKLELLKIIPLWNISDEKKEEKKKFMNLCIIQISLFHGSSIYYSRTKIISLRFNYTGGRMVVSPNKNF